MPIRRRFALLPGVVLLACGNPAGPAPRQLPAPTYRADVADDRTKGNVMVDGDLSAENTCNGDHVTMQGKSHQVFTVITRGDSLFVTVHSNIADAQGYGEPSGTRYNLKASQMERAMVVESPAIFIFQDTVRVNEEVVSQGSEPNLILRFTQIVSIVDNVGTVTQPKFSLECRG
jgi:hypothetical protein